MELGCKKTLASCHKYNSSVFFCSRDVFNDRDTGRYALSRSSYKYTFWLLITALIFRAMPPITLVAGYLPFYGWNLWGHLATTV